MFNVGSGEFLVILLVALVVLGPTRLPDALRQVGRFIGEAKKLSSNFQNEVNEAMKDPVKKVTGEEMPKLPKIPKNGKELIGFAVPEPFAAVTAPEKTPTSTDTTATDSAATDSAATDSAAADSAAAERAADNTAPPEDQDGPEAVVADLEKDAGLAKAEPAVAARVEPANLPPNATANGLGSDRGDLTTADSPTAGGEDDEVPMFGDR